MSSAIALVRTNAMVPSTIGVSSIAAKNIDHSSCPMGNTHVGAGRRRGGRLLSVSYAFQLDCSLTDIRVRVRQDPCDHTLRYVVRLLCAV